MRWYLFEGALQSIGCLGMSISSSFVLEAPGGRREACVSILVHVKCLE